MFVFHFSFPLALPLISGATVAPLMSRLSGEHRVAVVDGTSSGAPWMDTCNRLCGLRAANVTFKVSRRDHIKDGGMCRVASLL